MVRTVYTLRWIIYLTWLYNGAILYRLGLMASFTSGTLLYLLLCLNILLDLESWQLGRVLISLFELRNFQEMLLSWWKFYLFISYVLARLDRLNCDIVENSLRIFIIVQLISFLYFQTDSKCMYFSQFERRWVSEHAGTSTFLFDMEFHELMTSLSSQYFYGLKLTQLFREFLGKKNRILSLAPR